MSDTLLDRASPRRSGRTPGGEDDGELAYLDDRVLACGCVATIARVVVQLTWSPAKADAAVLQLRWAPPRVLSFTSMPSRSTAFLGVEGSTASPSLSSLGAIDLLFGWPVSLGLLGQRIVAEGVSTARHLWVHRVCRDEVARGLISGDLVARAFAELFTALAAFEPEEVDRTRDDPPYRRG